jgi:hypothetical protein
VIEITSYPGPKEIAVCLALTPLVLDFLTRQSRPFATVCWLCGALGTMGASSVWDEMDEQAAACRKRAAECERMVLLFDPANRSTYLHLARQWHQMAKDAERLNRLRPFPSKVEAKS